MAERHPLIQRLFELDDQLVTPDGRCNPDTVDQFIELERHSDDFLDAAIAHFRAYLVQALGEHQRNRRRGTRNQALRQRVFDTVDDVAAGATGTAALSALAALYVVDEGGTKKTVADMTGQDHLFVAASYSATAKHASLHCAFHKAVAKRIGPGCTAQVFSPQDYEELYRSMVLGPKRPARIDGRAA